MSKILFLMLFIQQTYHAQMIEKVGELHGYSQNVRKLAMAVAKQESNLRMVVGDAGKSIGLFQIKEIAARQYCKGIATTKFELMDVQKNIECGYRILTTIKMRHKCTKKTLAIYNAGHSKKKLDGKYKNQKYVNQVLARLE